MVPRCSSTHKDGKHLPALPRPPSVQKSKGLKLCIYPISDRNEASSRTVEATMADVVISIGAVLLG